MNKLFEALSLAFSPSFRKEIREDIDKTQKRITELRLEHAAEVESLRRVLNEGPSMQLVPEPMRDRVTGQFTSRKTH